MTAAILPLTKGHIKSYEKSSHLFSKKELGPQFVLYQEIQETVILKTIKKDPHSHVSCLAEPYYKKRAPHGLYDKPCGALCVYVFCFYTQ